MFKRMVSTLLVICIIFSTSVPVFAQDSISTDIQNEQNKIVSYIGEYKLVLWELGNIVYAEQYDSQGTLIVSGNANKTNGEINIFNNNTYSKFNATEIVETTIPHHCTRRIQPAMCLHRADLGATHPYHGHNEYPSHPRSGDHAPARSRSASLFETWFSLQSILIMPPA